MASEISSLGNSVGWIYVTQPDGTSLVSSLLNATDYARQVKAMGVSASSLALNQAAVGTINISACTGNGSITQILIGGINQISSSIAYTGATTPSQLAALIVTGINNYTPTGNDYTSLNIAGVVYVLAPSTAGSSVNGLSITVSNTGNLTSSSTDLSGGSDASNVYDQNFGYRFFLNATSGAVEGDLTGSTEITNFIVQRGMQAAADSQNVTISSGLISPIRNSSNGILIVNTEGSAASDDLTDIVPTGWAEWDTVIIRGVNAARIVTVKSSGNIRLSGSNDFSTGGNEKTLTIQYHSGIFYETARSTQSIGSVNDYRTAGFPFDLEGAETTAIGAGGGSKTLTVGAQKKLQSFTGNVTLGADYTITLDNTGAIAGDEFVLYYDATITKGAFDIKVVGLQTKTLTATQALRGSFAIYCYFTGSGWATNLFYNFFNVSPLPKIENDFIEDGTITAAKLNTSARTEILTVPVSFEATFNNATNKVKLPYACTVKSIYAIATKAIANTDNATITLKDNGGTGMTGGVITFTASDAQNTAYSSSVTANNTLSSGDLLTILCAKTTGGGAALVTIEIERN